MHTIHTFVQQNPIFDFGLLKRNLARMYYILQYRLQDHVVQISLGPQSPKCGGSGVGLVFMVLIVVSG